MVAGLSGLVLFMFVPYVMLDEVVSGPLSQWWHARPFEAEAWRDPVQRRQGGRQKMVADLLDRHDLDGWSRDQVIALLGPAERPDPVHGPDEMLYYLGPERGLIGIDSEMLVLHLDARGAVERVSFHTD